MSQQEWMNGVEFMSHNWSKQGNASKRPFSSKHVQVDRIMKITQGKLSNNG